MQTTDNIDEGSVSQVHLLGAGEIRRLAGQAGITPTKRLGQNFVIDPGTVRHIVRQAKVGPGDSVLEVGPGLGSLTLGLLGAGCRVTAVEIDPGLASLLPQTVAEYAPQATGELTVINGDALCLDPDTQPGLADQGHLVLVSNLPYNVATPIILTLLERFDNLDRFLVMVQKEVADRLVASPGSKIYGAPSLKLAWYGQAWHAGKIGRNVFWPSPNVDSALVDFARKRITQDVDREQVFNLVDGAFRQRRKTLRAALKGMVDGGAYTAAGVDPGARGESLTIEDFKALARANGEMTGR